MCDFPHCRPRHLTTAIQGAVLPPAASIHRPLLKFCGATAMVLAIHTTPASAFTYVVDTTADVPTPAKTTLRQAVLQANASADNIVQFDPGLNGSTITLTQGEIAINQSMEIVGPGADKLAISGNDTSRIFKMSTTNTSVTLSGLRLTHGNTYGPGKGAGGAVYSKNVSLTVHDAVLDYNVSNGGGAIASLGNNQTLITLTRVTIAKNKALLIEGGGLWSTGEASLHISGCVIRDNTTVDAGGAAALASIGSMTIENSQISGNQATTDGGGMDIGGGYGAILPLQITASAITGNGAGSRGGGLRMYNVDATLSSVTVSGNSASDGGGIDVDDTYATPVTNLTLEQSTVSGNVAAAIGGGIDVHRSLNFSLNRSLVSGNSVYDFVFAALAGGGGIAIQYVKNPAKLNDSTIYRNYAYYNGGGVGIFSASGETDFNGVTLVSNHTFDDDSNGVLGAGTTHLYNCIAAYNSSHGGFQDLAGVFSEDYSLVRNVGTVSLSGAHNKNGQNPLLGPLAVNGGPTLTMMPALSSPELDAGGPLATGEDQRGLPRNANGRRDMGAVERQYPEDIVFRNNFDSS